MNGPLNNEWQSIAANGICHAATMAQAAIADVAAEYARPSTVYRPRIYPDGNMWCALYGENLQDGVAGFGETPEKAMYDFDRNWHSQRALGAKS